MVKQIAGLLRLGSEVRIALAPTRVVSVLVSVGLVAAARVSAGFAAAGWVAALLLAVALGTAPRAVAVLAGEVAR